MGGMKRIQYLALLSIASLILVECYSKSESFEEDGGKDDDEHHYDEEDHKGEKGHHEKGEYDKGEKGHFDKADSSHHFDEVCAQFSLFYFFTSIVNKVWSID